MTWFTFLTAEMASRSATARRPESSSMVELREENERLQGLYTVSMIRGNIQCNQNVDY